MRRRAGWLVVALPLASYALLLAAWVVTDPPGATPDELDHYVKAVAAGHGDLRGLPPGPFQAPAAGARTQLAWLHRTTRRFRVPAGLSPVPLRCLPLDPALPATCLATARPSTVPTVEESHVGTYQPFAYVLPGAAARLADDPASGVRLARAVNAGLSLVLLALALLASVDRRSPAPSVVGPVAAVTPMVLFLGATPSASATEIVGALCLWAGVAALAVRPDAGWAAWAALVAGGAASAGSRSFGPLWVVAGVAVLLALAGLRPLRRAWARAPWSLATGLVLVAVAVAATLWWELSYQAHPRFSLAVFANSLAPSLGQLPRVSREVVGVFGPLRVPMSPVGYVVGAAVAGVVAAAALVVAGRRQRLVLLALVASCPVAAVLISAGVTRQTGFGLQGRYVLPLVVGVSLVSASILTSRADGLPGVLRRALAWVPAGAALVQGIGWYANARRYAVGSTGPRFFFSSARWTPPGGWWAWAAVVVVGMVLLSAVGPLASQRATRAWPLRRASSPGSG